MAEFCLDCLNRLEGTCYTKWDVSLSWSKDICEGCSQLRRTVICRVSGQFDGNISVYMMIITANHANKPILTFPLKPL